MIKKDSEEFGCIIFLIVIVGITAIGLLSGLVFGDVEHRSSEVFNEGIDKLKVGLLVLVLVFLYFLFKGKIRDQNEEINMQTKRKKSTEIIKKKHVQEKEHKPRELNPERKITQQDITKAKAIISREDVEAGKKITFEDFVVDSIERNGNKKTEDIYNGLVKIFELAGRDISTSDAIFNKYFD